jgi:fructose-1,6-bisphosphatase/sedoheptulose 1,7-bisphosphatase-like protein
MASRFPSIEEFDDGQAPSIEELGLDSGTIFDRERLALGQDADLFATTGDTDLLQGAAGTQKTHQQDTFEGTYFPSLDEPVGCSKLLVLLSYCRDH